MAFTVGRSVFGGAAMSKGARKARDGEANGVGVGLVERGTGLSLRQAAVADALASGQTPTEVAASCLVSRGTVYAWAKVPAFLAAVQARRERLAESEEGRLRRMAGAALDVVTGHLEDEGQSSFEPQSPRVGVALQVLHGLGLLGPGMLDLTTCLQTMIDFHEEREERVPCRSRRRRPRPLRS
jgi:hypothetical protein